MIAKTGKLMTKTTTKTIFASLTALLLLLGGCSQQPDQPQNSCGQGDALDADGSTYCVYRGEIIETGFECPEARPNRISYGDFEVCSPDENLPDEFPDRMEEQYDESGLPQDGCVRDGMCGSLEACQAGNCVAVPCGDDNECVEGEVCLQGDCRDEEALTPCDFETDCEFGELCVDSYCVADPDVPDTSDDRFRQTQCYEVGFAPFGNGREPNCRGNVGCTRFEVDCGKTQCELCADEYCLRLATNDCDFGFDAGSPDADADGG